MVSIDRLEKKTMVNRYLERKAGKGEFEFWNAETKKREKYDVREFVLISTGFTVKGFSKKHDSGLYSNEVEYISKEPLSVFTHSDKKIVAEWLRKDIGDKIKVLGGKLNMVWTVRNSEINEIWKLFFAGSALGEAIEATKKIPLGQTRHAIIEKKQQTTPTGIEYRVPVFGAGEELTEAELEEAQNLSKKLREEKNQRQEKAKKENTEISDDLDLPF